MEDAVISMHPQSRYVPNPKVRLRAGIMENMPDALLDRLMAKLATPKCAVASKHRLQRSNSS